MNNDNINHQDINTCIFPFKPNNIPPNYIGDIPYDPTNPWQPTQEFIPTVFTPITNTTTFQINPLTQLIGKRIVLVLNSGKEIEGEVVEQANVLDDNFFVLKTERSDRHYFPKTSIESFYVVEK